MRKKIRVAFFDIDGTLASHRVESSNFLDRVPESARQALRELRQNGIQPVIVTGREPSVIRQFVADLEMDTYIAANGLSLTHQGVEVWRQLLEPEVVAELLGELRNVSGVAVVLESTAGNVLCWNESPYAVDFDVSIEGAPERSRQYGVYQLAIIGDGLKGRIETKQKGLKTRVVAPLVLDILPEAVSKASAIERMLELLGLDRSQAIAFGDEENDLEMFGAVDYTVAMGNAIDALKQTATYVTDSVDEHGIYNACRHFGLV
ncbi:HAD family hydrolase [Eubacterium sp. 1001713B170207_170306_E7]|uniref:Cof-type HAD-IIB family hydrolase n=1 Tax=Eubacterium sp. 1001713B170207_170306_E7 TaxID=2787097 RepID=UPI001897FE67|nr:HAD family hydrolase [Eubacterium sp. 1001713B170207_170306_E7]